MPPVWLASMSDSCPTRAGCFELPRPADAERCSCTAPFADTHRPRPTFADGTDRTTVLPRSAHNSLGAGRDRKFSIVLSVTSRPARNRGPIGETGHRISLVQTAQNDDAAHGALIGAVAAGLRQRRTGDARGDQIQ